MRGELHLARRYLIGIRRRTHVATVTLISLVGLGLGVLALVVTLALLEGFQASIRAKIVGRGAHASVRPAEGRVLDEPENLVSVLQEKLPGVEIEKVVRGVSLVSSRIDAVPASVVGRSDIAGVQVDQVVAARLGVGVGDQLEVISPRQRLTPMGPLPVRLRVDVEGVRASEPGMDNGAVWLPLVQAQRLLWGREVVEAVELRHPGDPWGLGAAVREHLPVDAQALEVDGLRELHRPLLLALTLERIVIFAAVGLILVVAALNLLCNVAMVAAEKRKDLAVLSGLGMPPVSLRRLFLVMGLGIGLAGSAVGALLGTAIAVGLDLSGVLRLPSDVFAVHSVPFKVDPVSLAVVMVAAMVLAAGASWLPSRLVARRDPAEGLRYE